MDNSWKAFLKRVMTLTLPIIAQNFINMAVNSADVIMLTYVGQDSLSAASLAGEIQFVLSIVFFGLYSGASVLAAQYWGKGDKVTVEKVLGIAIRFSVIIAVLFAAAAFAFPGFLMRIFTNETPLIVEGVKYLRIICFSYILSGFSMMYLMVMRSVERVKLSAITYAISLAVNVVLNAVFIFRILGAPKLGIQGVALATCVARLTEVIICVIDSRKNGVISFKLRYALHGGKELTKDFWKYSLPTMVNEVIWSIGFTMYSVIIGHLGSNMVAAYSIAKVARNLGTVICFGISSACAVMVGKELGAGRIREAETTARRLMWVTVATGIVGGLLVIGARPVLMQMGDLTPQAREYLGVMMWIIAYYVLGQALNTTWICGVFRPGGDTKFGMYCDFIDLWVFSIPVTALCAFILKLPVMWVYFIMCLDEFVKMPFVIRRYRQKKWLKNITREYAD